MTSRRGFLAAIAAGGASAWLAAHATELQAASALAGKSAPSDPWLVLTPQEVAVLDAVTATLVPTDELPGAREAHVVRFIDRSLATFMKDDRKHLDEMMSSLAAETKEYAPDAASFAALDELDRIAVLQQFEQSEPQQFNWIRFTTIAGLFSIPSYGGNHDKVGWKMIGFEDRFIWTPPFGYYDRG